MFHRIAERIRFRFGLRRRLIQARRHPSPYSPAAPYRIVRDAAGIPYVEPKAAK